MVHGGRRFTEPGGRHDDVVSALRTLSPLAPLHNPANVEGIVRAQAAFPGIPHVAVFDTGFHRTLPPEAYTYAVPRTWRERAPRAPLRLPRQLLRLGGASHRSACSDASRRGRADGRAPPRQRCQRLRRRRRAQRRDLDGAVARWRGWSWAPGPGDVDPALGGYLARVAGMSAEDYDRRSTARAGCSVWPGSPTSARSRIVWSAGDADARLAFDVTVHRLRKYVGAYAAVLGRLDALVFTGGIGEHAPGCALRSSTTWASSASARRGGQPRGGQR